MLARIMRFAASPLALALALVLGACSDAAGPSAAEPSVAPGAVAPAASAAQVLTYSAVLEGISTLPVGDHATECLGEPIEVHYRGRLRVMLHETGSGERTLASVHTNDMGSWALGLETGKVYRLVGASMDKSTDGASFGGNGASTWTSSGHEQYVGPGGAAFSVHSSYGLTITPDGTLASERISSNVTCR